MKHIWRYVSLILLPLVLFASCTGQADVTGTEAHSDTEEESRSDEVDMFQQKELMFQDITEFLKISGRCVPDSNGLTWDWSASGVEFRAECEGDITLKYSSTANVWFRVWIDGVRQDQIFKGVAGNNATVIAKDLQRGIHTVKISRMTDVKSSLSVLNSLTVCGTLLERPEDNQIFVEFLGDSLTCGTGIMDGWQGKTEGLGGYLYMDATTTYAYQLANDYFRWDYSFVSVAGSHVATGDKYENYLDCYPYANYRRSTENVWISPRKADLVVINLGTNDANQRLDTEEFKTNLKTLIQTVREIHGEDVPILFVLCMMTNNYIPETLSVISEKGGENANLYSIKLDPDSYGASNHTSQRGHDDAAKEMAELIRKKIL